MSSRFLLRVGFSVLSVAPILSGAAWAAPLSDAAVSDVYAQAVVRRAAILQSEAGKPFPSPVCGQSNETSTCFLGKLNHALALLALGRSTEEIASANADIETAIATLPSAPKFNMEEESADAGEGGQPFHFMRSGILYRFIRYFGSAGSKAKSRLTAVNESTIDAVFWDWANSDCRLSDTGATHIWTPWGSENHDAQHDATCWEAADIFRQRPEYAGRTYEDHSSPSEQYAHWTVYLETYLRERARWGLVEYFSPTYAHYTLENIYTYADFSDDSRLRNLAHNFLELWWAEWAQEQVDGVFGGTATRVYAKTIPNGYAGQGLGWMYFGKAGNADDGRGPGIFPETMSGYVPAPVIADIALDTAGRGSYEVDARAPGLAVEAGCRNLGGMTRGAHQCSVNPSANVIRRVAYVTPQYVLGSAIVAKLPAPQWFAGSSQDREAGLVMAGADPRARIIAFPLAIADGGKHYNGLWAVQSKGTQIVEATRAPYGKNVSGMRVWFGAPLIKVESNGWVFVRGAAYAAVRPAFGGYHWDTQDPGWLVADNAASPVIVQAAKTDDYPSFAVFQTAVQNSELTVNGGNVEFVGLDGAGRVALADGVGRINGTVVDIAFGASLRSPFVNQALGSSQIAIAKGSRKLILDF